MISSLHLRWKWNLCSKFKIKVIAEARSLRKRRLPQILFVQQNFISGENYCLRKSADIEFSMKSNVVQDESIGTDRRNDEMIFHSNDNKENINLSSLYLAWRRKSIIEIDFTIFFGKII